MHKAFFILQSVSISIVLSLSLVGCNNENGTTGAAPASQSNLEVQAVNTEELLQRIDNSTAALVMVHVWATWCPPCREEFPELVKLAEAPELDDVDVVLVSVDPAGKTKAVVSFLEQHESPWGSIIAKDLDQDFIQALASEWSGAIPATFFFDPEGNRLTWWAGSKTVEHYREAIDKLLTKTTGGNVNTN